MSSTKHLAYRLVAILALLLREAFAALPLQMLVNLRGSECLYDKLNEGYVQF